MKAICEKLLTEWTDTHVLLAARDAVKGQEAVRDLVRIVGGNCQDRVELVVLDTSSDVSVLAAAEANKDQLYGIINNAGVSRGQCCFHYVYTIIRKE